MYQGSARTFRSALGAALALLLATAAQPAAGAALPRPAQDCVSPSLARVSEFNFFPDDYRSVIAAAPRPAEPGTTVRRLDGPPALALAPRPARVVRPR